MGAIDNQIAAIESAIHSENYYSANLLIRSAMQGQPDNPELMVLRNRLAELVRGLDDDAPIFTVKSPNTIGIQIVDNCNLKCFMCFRQNPTYYVNPFFKKPMSRAAFESLVEGVNFSNVASVCLGGSAEVFLHPDILYFMDCILERGCRVQFITNGSLIDSKLAEELAARSGYDLQLSLDAFSQETYESIRVGARFDDVIRKFTYFVQCLRKNNADVSLSIATVLMRRAIEEFPMIVRFAADLGIPVVTGINLVMTGAAVKYPEESLVFHPALFNQVRADSLALAAEVGVRVNLPEPFPLRREDRPVVDSGKSADHWDICHEPWTWLYMGSGGFGVCCGGHPGLPYRKEFMDEPEAEPFSLKVLTGHHTLTELFNSQVVRTLRRELVTNTPSPYCRNCLQQSNNLHNFSFHSAFNKKAMAPDDYRHARESFIKTFDGTDYLELMIQEDD